MLKQIIKFLFVGLVNPTIAADIPPRPEAAGFKEIRLGTPYVQFSKIEKFTCVKNSDYDETILTLGRLNSQSADKLMRQLVETLREITVYGSCHLKPGTSETIAGQDVFGIDVTFDIEQKLSSAEVIFARSSFKSVLAAMEERYGPARASKRPSDDETVHDWLFSKGSLRVIPTSGNPGSPAALLVISIQVPPADKGSKRKSSDM